MLRKTPDTRDVAEEEAKQITGAESASTTQSIMAAVATPAAKKASSIGATPGAAAATFGALGFIEFMRGDIFATTLLAMSAVYFGTSAETKKAVMDRGTQVANTALTSGMNFYAWAQKQLPNKAPRASQAEPAPRPGK